MSTPGSVATTGQTVRSGSPEALRLYTECRTQARQFLSESLQQLFQKADDTLFEFAEKSGSDANSGAYFTAMRALRLKREEIAARFLEQVDAGFRDICSPSLEEGHSASPAMPTTLSLVDEAELEESLAVQSMVDKVENTWGDDLGALRQRLAHVAGRAPFDRCDDPVGPTRIGESFRDALAVLDSEIEVRLILYKLFDKFLLSHMGELYADLNRHLAKAGVLPELRSQARVERAKAPRAPAARKPGMPSPEPEEEGGDATEAELLPLLRELLVKRRGGQGDVWGPGDGGGQGEVWGPGDGGGGAANLYTPSPQEVMAALTALQQQTTAAAPSSESAPAPSGDVRTALDEEFRRIAGAAGAALSRQENDLIDLISMLFEFILEDRGLPDTVRVLLARLQIPMLKVALADRTFFSKTRHPARRLLNMLAKAGIGLDDTLRPDNSPRLQEIERIVRRVLEEFTDDISLFDTLVGEFETFLQKAAEREQFVEKKQSARLRTREAKEQIRVAVNNKIDQLLAGQEIPEPVVTLLRGPWTEVLIATRLAGKENPAWPARAQLLQDMIASVTPKTSREERLAVAALIGRLLATLRNGLESIGLSSERIDALIAEIEPYHLAVVQGKPLPRAAEPETPAKPEDPVEAMIREMKEQMAELAEEEQLNSLFHEHAQEEDALSDELEEEEPEDQEPPPPEEYLELARSFPMGTWFTFTDEQGATRRAKLSWKSTLLDECIFLDWKMKVVAELNMAQLARRLHEGSIIQLGEMPLFDRAMDALMGRLRGGESLKA